MSKNKHRVVVGPETQVQWADGAPPPELEIEDRYYVPNGKLVEFARELETKVSLALNNANLDSDEGLKEFMNNIIAVFYDVWLKASSDPIGKYLAPILAEADDEMARLANTQSPSQAINGVAKAAGRVITFLKITAPRPESESVPTFAQAYADVLEREETVTLTKKQLSVALGLAPGVDLTLGFVTGAFAGAKVVAVGGVVATAGGGVYWYYKEGRQDAKNALEKANKYIVVLNKCMKTHRYNPEKIKHCLINEHKLTPEEADWLIGFYQFSRDYSLSWAFKEGLFVDKTQEVLKIINRQITREQTPYNMMPVSYYQPTYCPMQAYNYYFRYQCPYYRQIWEILNCFGTGHNWLRINFADGPALIVRLDSIDLSKATGYARRQNINVICNGNIVQTKEQAQVCLNKWVQVMLPNQITLRVYLTYFDENYIGGYTSTGDLLALSEKVNNIECFAQPI